MCVLMRMNLLMYMAGDIGGGSDVPAGVRDVRGGVHLRRGQQAHIAAGPIHGRGAHRHRHDLRHRTHLRRAHEPRGHALLCMLPAFPMDSGILLSLFFPLFTSDTSPLFFDRVFVLLLTGQRPAC
jgi:hypothetical protein